MSHDVVVETADFLIEMNDDKGTQMNQTVGTPCYVLLNDKQRIGPKLLPSEGQSEGVIIYGFSDKPPYDRFCENSDLELTPYPLVKGYLQNQLSEAGTHFRLVAVDAEGPDDEWLHAVTMQTALEAQQQSIDHVAISAHLRLDRTTMLYRIEDPAVDPIATA